MTYETGLSVEKLVLKTKRIPLWFELGFFNLAMLALFLPLVWLQYLIHAYSNMCGNGSELESFFHDNLLRLQILAIGLPSLTLAELASLIFWLDKNSLKSLKFWYVYIIRRLLYTLPFVLLLLNIMALSQFQAIYASVTILSIITLFNGSSFAKRLNPVFLLGSQEPSPPRQQLKFILHYLALGFIFPSFIFSRTTVCQDRAKISSVKANMHTFQTIVETYAVDWSGTYAKDLSQLRTDALTPGRSYWKEFTNSLTGSSGENKSYATLPANKSTLMSDSMQTDISLPYRDVVGIRIYHESFFINAPGAGMVLYDWVSPSKYYIYGLDKNGKFTLDKGVPFVLTNS